MESDGYSKTKEEQINENIATAVAVHSFLLSLPESISRVVFKSVVTDAYEIADLLDRTKSLRSLARALLESFNPNYLGPTEQIDHYLNANECHFIDIENEYIAYLDEQDKEKIEKLVTSLAEKLVAWHHESLPDKNELVRAYALFSISSNEILEDEGYYARAENTMRQQLRRIDGQYDKLEMEYPLEEHSFYSLGFQTFFYKWAMGEEYDKKALSLIYRWYCKGEVLDYVIEGFKRAEARAIKDRMWKLFLDGCSKDMAFRDIFQARYDVVMENLSSFHFACDADSSFGMAALDPIPLDINGRVDVTPEQYQKLYEEIGPTSNKPYVKCTAAEFIRLFSGKGANIKKAIIWFGKGIELADFLACCQGITCQSSRTFINERARQLFINHKKDEPFEVVTMKKCHPYSQNNMRNLFNRCGIRR